jgi:hypothetical protein
MLGSRRYCLVLLIVAQTSLGGCTSAQLRSSTVGQSMTLSDIYTQQVMTNLAMFAENPAAIPSFAFPNQGTASIQDSANVGGPGYLSGSFVSSPFTVNAARQATENWVLVPVSDAAKLALMRCAYQQAIATCIGVDLSSGSKCPDCQALRKEFYGAEKSSVAGAAYELPCLNEPSCWLKRGCEKDVPRACRAPYVGTYGETRVWVEPDGREMLARLTLTILDYATNDATQFATRTKSVEMTVDENGELLAGDAKGGVKITATIPIDQPSAAVRVFEKVGYGQYAKEYSKDDATKVEEAAVAFVVRTKHLTKAEAESTVRKKEFWQTIRNQRDNPDARLPEGEQRFFDSPDYKRLQGYGGKTVSALKLILDEDIIPHNIPDDAVLRAPIVKEKKGSASQGLQALGQRIDAAEGK